MAMIIIGVITFIGWVFLFYGFMAVCDGSDWGEKSHLLIS